MGNTGVEWAVKISLNNLISYLSQSRMMPIGVGVG